MKAGELPTEANPTYGELKNKVLELEKLLEQVSAENNEIQMSFFRNIYHEIRTPLNSMLGFSSLLESKGLNDEARSWYADQIGKSSTLFLQFIDDLVEASLLENQKIRIESSWFQVNDLLMELYHNCNLFRHTMDKSNVALLLNKTHFDRHIHAEADRRRMFQIIKYQVINYIMKADRGIIEIGFTPTLNKGLSFYIKASPELKECLTDTGIAAGIGPSCGSYGTQLRKHLSEQLVGLMKGCISAEQNNLGGTTIRIVICPKDMTGIENLYDCQSAVNRMAM
jgi:hypothetical protein